MLTIWHSPGQGGIANHHWASQVVKNPPPMQAMQETLVSSLSWEDPLEKEMATHSNILAWKIPWTEEHSGL